MTTSSTEKKLRVKDFHFHLDIPTAKGKTELFVVRADFSVAEGERVALFAPSGSGKTTLLRWMIGVDRGTRRDRGELWFEGKDLAVLPPEKRDFGWVPQDYGLFESWSTVENLAYPLRLRGVGKDERETKARDALAKLGLSARAETLAGNLSGGEKQRVSLARALIFRPKALLLDEPFSALDPVLRESAREWVHAQLEESKVPCLWVTHDPEDVRKLSTRVLEYRDGFWDR